MGLLRRHRWFAAAAGFTLVFALVCLGAHQSPGLTFFGDLWGLAAMLAGLVVCALNIKSRPREECSFWVLLALGFILWATNQAAWTVWENVLHRPIPDPFVYDIVLFFHVVPLIAAVAWRPDFAKKGGKVFLGLLNFLMLFGWWVFLYAFIVFPHQYIVQNVHKYNVYYDGLYGIENAVLVAVLILAVLTSSGGWRRLYLHLLGASLLYAINSRLLDRAEANNTYFSGSPYDFPLIGTVAWISAAALSAREWNLETVKFNMHPRWKRLVEQLAMLAILSLPILGLWTVLGDKSPAPSREFRVFAVLGAMLLLGTFVFLRQYLQDQALMALLKESRRAYDSQKELQRQLVQKEKLASLGNLVAGAAHDINHPLNAIMTHSDELWGERLGDEQDALLRKIVNQARRTHDSSQAFWFLPSRLPEKRPRSICPSC